MKDSTKGYALGILVAFGNSTTHFVQKKVLYLPVAQVILMRTLVTIAFIHVIMKKENMKV